MRTSPGLIAVLAAFNAVAPFSIDMYSSAFPQTAADFNASTSSIRLTLTAFLVGLASGELIIGQLSGRYGVPIGVVMFCGTSSAAVSLVILTRGHIADKIASTRTPP